MEGKAAVRLNSLKHGLRAKNALLRGEDETAFEEISQAFHQQHNPEGPSEQVEFALRRNPCRGNGLA